MHKTPEREQREFVKKMDCSFGYEAASNLAATFYTRTLISAIKILITRCTPQV